MTPKNFPNREGWPGSRDPLNFWAGRAEATDYKFDRRVDKDSPDMTLKNFIQKGAWPRSRDPPNFCALIANSSKTVKATDFKFDTHVPRDCPDMTPKILSKRGRGHGHVTPKFLCVKC